MAKITLRRTSLGTGAKKKKKWWSKDDTTFVVLSLPTVVWLICFCYLPLFGILLPFKDFKIVPGRNFIVNLILSPWVGLKNFQFLLGNPDTALVVRNTLLYNLAMIPLGIICPVALALMISELRNRVAAKVYQTILFLPNFLSWVVVGTVVWAFLGHQLGMVNTGLQALGLEAKEWYFDPAFWPPFLVLLSQWKGIGFGSIIYLAAITSLDKAVYEAAIIDGATKRQQMWYITLPLIKRIVVLMLIMSVGGLFGSDFGLFYIVPRSSGPLYDVTTTTSVLVYKLLKGSTIGMSGAAGILMAAVGCALTFIVNGIVRKVDNESAML